MSRSFALIVILGACASGPREVSTLRYTSTDCPDPKGCEAPLGEQEYQLPDESHDPIADAAATSEAPSCESVAVALVALELGNYASDADDREQVHDKHVAACQAAKLDARETACLSSVTSTDHVGYCTKKMGAPTMRIPMLSKAECKQTMDTLRPLLERYNQLRKAPAYEASCVEDGWSNELADCMTTKGGYYSEQQCLDKAPGWVFAQMQMRLEKLTAQK